LVKFKADFLPLFELSKNLTPPGGREWKKLLDSKKDFPLSPRGKMPLMLNSGEGLPNG
jgi:hypothetical protein